MATYIKVILGDNALKHVFLAFEKSLQTASQTKKTKVSGTDS